MPPLTIPILALLLTLLGLVLLISGLRGRIINARPHCRRCAFDLAGAPGITELLSLDSPPPARCPECATTLITGAHLRLGRRQRRPARIFLASILLLLALPGVVLPIASVLLGPPTLTKLPDSLLELQALYAPDNARLPAIEELLARRKKGGWSNAGLTKLADNTLQRTNATGDIPPSLSPLLQAAFNQDLASPKPTTDWLAKRFTLSASVTSKARHGQPLPFRFRATPNAPNHNEHFFASATLELDNAAITAVDAKGVEHDCGHLIRNATLQLTSQGHGYAESRPPISLEPGTYTLRATFPYRIRFTPRMQAGKSPATPEPTTRGSVQLNASCTIFPPDAPIVALNADPELARALRESLTRAKIVAAKRGTSFPTQSTLFLKSTKPLPAAGYFNVAIEAIDPAPPPNWTATSAHNLHVHRGHRQFPFSVPISFAPGFEPKSVRVTLTPNQKDAELNSDSLQLTEIADAVITLDCVPVEWRTDSHLGHHDPGDF